MENNTPPVNPFADSANPNPFGNNGGGGNPFGAPAQGQASANPPAGGVSETPTPAAPNSQTQPQAPAAPTPLGPSAQPAAPQNAPAAPAAPKGNNGEAAIVLDIKETEKKKESIKVEKVSLFDQINDWLINMSGIKLDEKLLFFQLLGSMIGAGLPIIDAMNLLINQTKNEKLKRVIEDMRKQIEDGQSLAASMRYNDDVFDEATCSVIEAGEKSGKLNAILKELVAQYEQMSKLTKKVKSVMTYPVIVVVFMVVLTIVVLVFVVPKLEELFGGGENLPLPTRILINGSDFVMGSWYFLIIGAIAAAIAFIQWKKSKKGSKQWAAILLRMPLVGPILQKMILTRVTRIFGFLISAGVPVVESLRIASHIAESEIYQEKLLLAADDLTKGISIAENLSDDERLFPTMLVNMMAIGEKTASLDTVMGKAADFYNEELERKISVLEKSMEPIILAIIACAAVFMILAIYLPILKMNDQVVGSF